LSYKIEKYMNSEKKLSIIQKAKEQFEILHNIYKVENLNMILNSVWMDIRRKGMKYSTKKLCQIFFCKFCILGYVDC
jgi:hypothetical protein